MGRNDEKLSRIIEYKGIFDISNIINNFEKMKQELTKRGANKSDILNLDEELQKIQQLNKTITNMISKGFKTPKEFAQFEKLTEQAQVSMEKLADSFRKIDKTGLDTAMKNASRSSKEAQTYAQQLASTYEKNLNSILKESELRGVIIRKVKENIQNIKDGKGAEHNITEELKKQFDITKQDHEKAKLKAQQAADTLKSLKEQTAELRNIRNLSYSENNKNFKSNFLQRSNYKKDGQIINDGSLSSVMQELSSVMEKPGATVEKFQKGLSKLGIELVNAANKQELFINAAKLFREQIAENKEKIKEQTKEVNLMSNNVKVAEQTYKKFASAFGTGENEGNGTLISEYNLIIEAFRKATIAQENFRNKQVEANTPLPGLEENIKLQGQLNNSLQQGIDNTKKTINEQRNLDSAFEQIGNRLKYIFSFMNMYHVALRQIRQTFNDIQKIDKAFAEIAMVTDKTIDDMWGQYDDYAKIANELGQTTESVIKSSALYYQQGLSAAEALTLTKDTMKLATLANIDFKESTKLMTAALRSFHMEMEEGSHVTDVYSELAAHAAANVQDIAYAMSKTSSIAASAGMKFENLSAMLTTMIESTQEAPENLGTAMKSVVARFTEVKKDVSNLDSDIDLEGFDINKVDTALKSVGIQLKDDIGQIRDLDSVFLELSEKWNTLDRNTQRYIATIAAGSRQQSRFIALMENYERTIELIEVANNSAGRSGKQFEKYAGSVENKINRLKNTWEQFKLNLIDEKTYKKGIDFVNNFLNRFTKLDKKQLTSFIALGVTVGKNLILGIIQTIKNSSNLFSSLTQTLAFKGKTRIEIESNIQDIKNQIISLNPKVEELSRLMGESFKTKGLQTYESELNKVGYTLDATRTELTFLDITSADFDKTFKQIAATGKLNGEIVSELSQHFKNLRNSEDTVFGSTTRLKRSLEELNNQQIRAANFRVGGQIIGSALGTAATTAFTGTFNPEETVNMIMAQSATMGVNSFSNALTSAFGREQGTFKDAFSKAGGEMALLSIGISGITYAIKEVVKSKADFDKWNGKITQSAHILADNFNKAKEKIEEQTEVIAEASNKVDEFNNTYEDVFKADKTLKELSNKINLTEEEQSKLNEATSTMIELMPEVITGYDKEGNAIVQINDYYREQIKLLKEKQILLQQNETVESIKGLNDIIGLGVEAESIEKRIEEQVNNNITRIGLTISDGKGGKYELNEENFDEKVIDYLYSMLKPMKEGILDETDAQAISQIFLMALNTSTNNKEITEFQDTLKKTYPELKTGKNISASAFNYGTGGKEGVQNYASILQYITPLKRSDVWDLDIDPSQAKKHYNEKNAKLIRSGKYYVSLLDTSYEERWTAEYNRLLLEEGLTQEELEKAKKEIRENYTKIQNAFQEYMNEELSLELNKKPLKHEDRKSLLQNLLINWAKNDDQAFEQYKKEVQEKGQELDIKEFLEKTYKDNDVFKNFLEMAPEEIDKLSDEQYEVISDYYINLYNYSAKKRREIVQKFKKTSPELYTLLSSQNLATEKEEQTNINKIRQTYGYYSKPNSGWEAQNNKTQEYKTSALIQRTEQGLIPSYILNQINDYASEMGDNAQAFFDAWQKWFEQNYPEDKELTEDEENKLRFFANIDPTQLSQYNINSYAAQGKEKGYWDTLDKGKEEIQKYAKDTKMQIQNFSLGDLSDIKDEYSQKMENLSGQMSKLQPMLSSDSKVITLTSKNLNDLYDFIEFANKPVDKGGLGLNLNPEDYHTGNQMTDEQIKKLKDDVNYTFAAAEDLANFIATLKDKKDKGTISILEKSILNTAESLGLMNLLRNAPKVVPDSELEGKINAIKEISSELKGLEQNYESIYQDMYENGILSASSISGLYSSAEKLNPLLSKQGLNQLDLSKILYQTADGWGANTVALEQYIKETIKGLKAKEYVNELTPEGEELLNSLKLLEIQMNIFKTENAKKELEKYSKAAEDAAKKMKELEESQKEFVKSTGSMVSNLKSAASEMIKNGKITSSTYSSLVEDIKKINERYNTGMSIENYVDAEGNFNWAKYEADLKTFILKLKEEGIEADYLTQVLNDLKDMHEELDEELEKVQEDYNKSLEEVKEKTKSVEEANKSLSEAYKDLAEKEKKVTEAQETLNEAMYGTGNKRKSTLDGMYNYEQLLDTIDSRLDSIKTNLEHIQPGDDIAALVNEYGQGVHNKKVNLEAQKQTYERNLSEIMSNLSSYSNYFTEQGGRLLVNVAALNAASMNDKIKDEIENQVQMYNNSAKKVSDIEKQIKQVEQDYLDFKNSYRDKYIALQEKVISTLKEEAQKELDTQKEKYTAMEEADNEYTDALEKAIQKQRDLRAQANEWEELATKEKKLSLLERDTSGANAKDVLKQQEDVEKTRQNLLDKGVDNIIKNLKDLYNDQKKSRDAEIKYQEAVLNNATYIEEANAVINSWQTADDLISWFYEHSQEVQSMTNEQLEAYNEELEELYNDRKIYMNTSMEDFINMLDVQESEIDNTVSNVAEHLTLESERSLHAVIEEVDKAIEKARGDIQSAINDVEEAKNKITEAIENVAKAVQELETANKNAAESAKLLADAERQKAEVAAASSNLSSSSSNSNISKSAIQQHIENITEQRGKGWTNTVYTFTDSEMEEISKALGIYMANMNGVTYWGSDLNDLKKNMGNVNATYTGAYFSNGTKVVTQFEKGGLVNYTGPAWVDGTPAQPEAFLSAKDTQMISNFTDVLRSLYASIGSSNSQQVNPSIGDTHIEVHINIENVASDYDVDSAVERVKQDIIDAANQTGRNVILYQ